jgi:uncharacterized protein (DUF1015 family)
VSGGGLQSQDATITTKLKPSFFFPAGVFDHHFRTVLIGKVKVCDFERHELFQFDAGFKEKQEQEIASRIDACGREKRLAFLLKENFRKR